MAGIGESGSSTDIVVGEFVDQDELLGHGLAIWDDRQLAAQRRIGQVLVGGDAGPDKFVDGPLTLHETQLDGIAGFLIAMQVMRVELGMDSGDSAPPVEISLDAARRDPTLILGMVRTAPPTEFHRRIIEADVASFEARFERYRAEGLAGLWESLRMTPDEADAIKTPGTWKRQVETENKREIDDLRKAEEKRIEERETSGFQPRQREEDGAVEDGEIAQWVYDYIVKTDEAFLQSQEGASEGVSTMICSPMTQERLERLSAIKYAFAVGGLEVESEFEVKGPDGLKLAGLRYVIDRMWKVRDKQQLAENPAGYARGERSPEVSNELLEAEALYIALAAKSMLLQQQGAEAAMNLLVESIGRIEDAQVSTLIGQRHGGQLSRFLAFDAGDYTEEEFRRVIQVAGSAWRVVNRFGTSEALGEFETNTYERIYEAIKRGGGVEQVTEDADVSAASTALPVHVRFGMSADDYELLGSQALEVIGAEGGPIGASREAAVRWYLETQAGYAARVTDHHGRYAQQHNRRLEQLGTAQREKDFPGRGRMLTFYGDLNLNEGTMGVLEALGAISGLYDNLDSAGNLPDNPMAHPAVRDQLEKIAPGLQVNEPFRGIFPPDYKCEAAHFVGRMQSYIKPSHIASPVIPSGFATLQVRSNRALVQQIMQAGSDRYIPLVLPSQLVRFLRTDGVLKPELGHTDPRWQPQWKDRTLAVFMNTEDGRPSALYLEVSRLFARLAGRQIEA